MADRLRSRLARLVARIPRAEPVATIAPLSLDDAEWMAIARALGAEGLRSCAAGDPALLEELAATIEFLEREGQGGRTCQAT
jgi:hypothetical protein